MRATRASRPSAAEEEGGLEVEGEAGAENAAPGAVSRRTEEVSPHARLPQPGAEAPLEAASAESRGAGKAGQQPAPSTSGGSSTSGGGHLVFGGFALSLLFNNGRPPLFS